ncbi:hypothetical protein BJX99DRAFT_97838 [Aspergillus californicus]
MALLSYDFFCYILHIILISSHNTSSETTRRNVHGTGDTNEDNDLDLVQKGRSFLAGIASKNRRYGLGRSFSRVYVGWREGATNLVSGASRSFLGSIPTRRGRCGFMRSKAGATETIASCSFPSLTSMIEDGAGLVTFPTRPRKEMLVKVYDCRNSRSI